MHGSEPLILGLKIVAMFLVMAVGFWSRRRELITGDSTAVLARICTDITLPPMIFMQMVRTVDLPSLRLNWLLPLLAIGAIGLGCLIGWINWRLVARRSQAPVYIFASGMSNWIYLPLPIIQAIYGTRGLQSLFLCNLGIQVQFWSMGVAILHGGKVDLPALRRVAVNPGLIATVLGIVFAVVAGVSGTAATSLAAAQPYKSVIDVVSGALDMLGSATIPISMLVTGAQIAMATVLQGRPTGAIAGIVANRLILTPLIVIAGLAWVHAAVPAIPVESLLVVAIVAMMPVSVTLTVLTEKMNQDTPLAAQAVLWTTLTSIVTVPPLFILARKVLG